MGTEHYLVDYEKKIAFDCHKWYALAMAADEDEDDWELTLTVTEATVEATRGMGRMRCNWEWLRAAVLRWMRWHGLESVKLERDCFGLVSYTFEQQWEWDLYADEDEEVWWADNGWELTNLWGKFHGPFQPAS